MRGFSLALLRHRLHAAAQARADGALSVPQDRPDGRLLWLHVGEDADPTGAQIVLSALCRIHTDLSIVATGIADRPGPADTPSTADAFLAALRPDVALFIGNDLYPVLWSAALDRAIPLVAAEIAPERHPPGMIRPLSRFEAVLSSGTDPAPPATACVGPLSTVPLSPGVDAAALDRMAHRLAGRPLWLALDVDGREIAPVLTAHRIASRMSHRLLLILCAQEAAARDAFAADGWRWCHADDDAPPPTDCQVMLAPSPYDRGLWMRLAPITFLGGTLEGRGPVTSPLVPASLGSALIHGPRMRAAGRAIARLHEGRAACRIGDADALGLQVERLLSPDAAAELARGGWVVTSVGAEASARLLEVLDDILVGIDV